MQREVAEETLVQMSTVTRKVDANDILGPVDPSQYQDLVCWLLQFQPCPRFDSFLAITQFCDSLPIQRSTKYLAKSYLDQCMLSNDGEFSYSLKQIALGCCQLAIKFNEERKVSQSLVEYCLQVSNQHSNPDQIVQMEGYILQTINYKLKVTSPFDYLPVLLELFPALRKQKKTVISFIDFAMSLQQSLTLTAEDLFLGCLCAALDGTHYQKQLNQVQKLVCNADWVYTHNIGRIIKEELELLTGPAQ